MSNIQVLSLELANMISAGEVVERPASVIKELVENSIDAGATTIRVSLIESGLKKIEVSDNGTGLSKEDIPIAIKAHATSKIKSVSDLFNISSLGFRGEALPSIASVSILTIKSSVDGLSGNMCKFKAGIVVEENVIPLPKGTEISVENLFFNTPARFNHLSNLSLELYHITNYLNKQALANPGIQFTLLNNDRVIFQTDGKNDYLSVIKEIYGVSIAKAMIEFKGENNYYKIKGFASTNEVFRSNKNAINVIVNGRVIKNQGIIYAVTDAYKTILPINKYPIVVIYITTDAGLIDVNVHPSKLEIRFTGEEDLKRLITDTIKNFLFKKELINEPIKDETAFKEDETKEDEELPTELLWEMFDDAKEPLNDQSFVEEAKTSLEDEEQTDQEMEINPNIEQLSINEPLNFFTNLSYLGHYNKTYLLMESHDNLYIIDQHAAMERVMYEKISNELFNPCKQKYELLIPIKFDLTNAECECLILKKEEFSNLGIDFDLFGNTSILVRAIPLWIKPGLEKEFVSDIIEHILNYRNSVVKTMLDGLAKKLSCKKSIKANMAITQEEISTLLQSLDKCKMPYTCPHGRPTIIKFSKYDIEKLFKRVI